MNFLCVPGKLLSVLDVVFHLILTMTIRGGDIINTTLQMRELKCTKIEVMELKCSGAGLLTQAFLTLRPELSTAMLSSSCDNHVFCLADGGNGGQDLDKGLVIGTKYL